jgi:hypothetical protein
MGRAGIQPEHRHRLHQVPGLVLQAVGRGGAFFHQRGVLLGGLVHLADSLAHLGHAVALLGAGRGDLADDVADPADGGDDLAHGLAGPVHQGRALLDLLHAAADQGLDLAGGIGAALGQGPHLAGHHREAAALLAGAGGFHRRVQGQDVGLEGDAVDHADDVADLAAALVDLLHGGHHLADHLAALHRHAGRALGQLVGLLGAVGVVAHGGTELLHGGGRFLQGAGLLLGAAGQIQVALGDLGTGGGDALGVLAHGGHHADQAGLHAVQGLQQLGGLVPALGVDAAGQVALGHGGARSTACWIGR